MQISTKDVGSLVRVGRRSPVPPSLVAPGRSIPDIGSSGVLGVKLFCRGR
ncbi:MAG TPA: hypothetical protein IGS52_08570 [Oscillatoriaceae cyanobacterium M33_DOE_052]|nr:hypothetical protein [Oscillatoriaceae cyanobacterium M33_DOE_052]